MRYVDPSGHIPIDCYNDPSYCSNTTTLPSSPYPSPDDDGGGGNDDVDWPDVADALIEEAQNIRNDYWSNVWEDLIAQGIMGGVGAAVGWAVKCPFAKHYCVVAGFVAGTLSEVAVEGQVAMAMEGDANAYEATASLILQGMDESGQTNLSVTHLSELTIGPGVSSPLLIDQSITFPEHYALSVEGGSNTVILLPAQLEYVNMIIQSHTGP